MTLVMYMLFLNRTLEYHSSEVLDTIRDNRSIMGEWLWLGNKISFTETVQPHSVVNNAPGIWRKPLQQHLEHNGNRAFTSVSSSSICRGGQSLWHLCTCLCCALWCRGCICAPRVPPLQKRVSSVWTQCLAYQVI